MIHIEKYSQVHIDFSVPDLNFRFKKNKNGLAKGSNRAESGDLHDCS